VLRSRPFCLGGSRRDRKEDVMQWDRILEGATAILAAGLIVFIIQLFLPENHKRRMKKALWRIIRYLL